MLCHGNKSGRHTDQHVVWDRHVLRYVAGAARLASFCAGAIMI